MKKYLLPFFLLVSWALTSCSSDDEAIADYDQDFSAWTLDGTPAWLDQAIIDVAYTDIISTDLDQYIFSSDSRWLHHDIARVHEIDGKQYVSLTHSIGKEYGWKAGHDFTVLYSDESSEIRKLGHYAFRAGYYTPGGVKISSKKLINRINSDKGSIIYYYGGPDGGLYYSDRVYGLSDIQEWISPYYRDNLKSLCMDRLNNYGTSFFMGKFAYYIISHIPAAIIDEADTDGRGMPFALVTYTMNNDGTLTRHFESFIAAEDGSISPLPLKDITDIAHRLGRSDFDPLRDITPIYPPSDTDYEN